jgi:TRAP-type C4-dicarboxylate transport system permease small subunit
MNMKMLERGEKAFDGVLDILAVCASVLIFFIMFIVCYEVISRYFFNAPTTWVVEIASIILLFTPFLVGGWVLRKDGHVKMDLVLEQFSKKNQALINTTTSMVAALVCLILVAYGTKLAWDFYKTNYYTNTFLRLPQGPILSIIPFGFLLLFIQSLRRARDSFGDWVRLRT